MERPKKNKARARTGDALPPQKETREWPWWLAFAIAVLPMAWTQITTSDAWWHVALGRAIVSQGWPDFAQFYFTPVNPRVPDLRWEAAGDVLFYFAWKAGGTWGLQALSVGALAGACAALRAIHPGRMNGWLLALLLAVAFATLQLQLPRNSVVSLPLVGVLFWMFARWRRAGNARWLWGLVPLLALWGVLHGSYLLGIVLVALLLAGDLLDTWREKRPQLTRHAGRSAAIVAACLAVNMAGNAETARMFENPVRSALGLAKPAAARRAKAEPVSAAPVQPAPFSLKVWLNNLIWPASADEVRSGDFVSPFDRLEYRPVPASFALSVLALVFAALTRPVRASWLLAFGATAFLGICYFRMTGYAALGAAALILAQCRNRRPLLEPLAQRPWIGTGLAALFAVVVWLSLARGGLGTLIGRPNHVTGSGKICTFDDAACDWVFARGEERRCFTTIVTGSYALLKWGPDRRVFIDGFFGPHPRRLWREYLLARTEGRLAPLHEKYGVQLALIEHTRRDWIKVFNADADWRPAAIGPGCMVYAHRTAALPVRPELLFTDAEVATLAPIFRECLALNYYQTIAGLVGASRGRDAQEVISADPALFRNLRTALPASQRPLVSELEIELQKAIRAEAGTRPAKAQ